MALAATLSTRRCVPLSPSWTHGPLPCPPKYMEMKPSRGGCALPALFLPSCVATALPAKESSGVLTPIASGSGSGGSISRREAVLQVLSGAGRSLFATGLACSAATLVEDFPSAFAAVNDVAAESKPRPQFYDLDGSGGVKALDIRKGTGATPQMGDKVAIHYYARLAAKQGWRFDSSYDHKDQSGSPEPYVFVIGDGTVIAGLDSALRSMKEGGVRRVIIPPAQGYQNTEQGPIPPNFSDRQRLYTTIFNPTRLANGEGSTLGILVFDIELLGIRHN